MGSRHELPEGGRIRILSASGGVNVIAEDRPDIDVEPPRAKVQQIDGHIVEVKSRSGRLTVRCPRGANVSIGSGSGGLKLEGVFGSLKISAVSGGIEIDRADGDVDVRAVSGSITIRSCGGACSLSTKSGSIRVGHATGEIHAHTISGAVEVATDGAGDVSLKAISGSMTVTVPPEKRPRVRLKSMSGRLKCDCEQGSDFEIKGASISGSLHVKAK